MLFIIAVAGLVLTVTYFQVSQGVFSALIMALLSVLCAMIALNFYQPAAALLYEYQPAHADAIALIVLFAVPLLGLRFLFDSFLGANVVMGMWANRIGGGAFGFLAAMVIAGIFALVMQMLPWSRTVIGYSPYDDSLERNQRLAPFYPDEFVLKLASSLSAGSLKDRRPFAKAHEGLLLDLHCARNRMFRTIRDEKNERHSYYIGRPDAPADALTKAEATVIEPFGEDVKVPQYPLLKNRAKSQLMVVTAAVDESAAGEDGWWRLAATQFRLVTRDGKSYYPNAFMTDQGKPAYGRRRGKTHSNRDKLIGLIYFEANSRDVGNTVEVKWLYQIDADAKPSHLVFRRIAKRDIKMIKE